MFSRKTMCLAVVFHLIMLGALLMLPVCSVRGWVMKYYAVNIFGITGNVVAVALLFTLIRSSFQNKQSRVRNAKLDLFCFLISLAFLLFFLLRPAIVKYVRTERLQGASLAISFEIANASKGQKVNVTTTKHSVVWPLKTIDADYLLIERVDKGKKYDDCVRIACCGSYPVEVTSGNEMNCVNWFHKTYINTNIGAVFNFSPLTLIRVNDKLMSAAELAETFTLIPPKGSK